VYDMSILDQCASVWSGRMGGTLRISLPDSRRYSAKGRRSSSECRKRRCVETVSRLKACHKRSVDRAIRRVIVSVLDFGCHTSFTC